MSRISTHVLDTSLGRPAAGIPVRLQRRHSSDTWRQVGSGQTDQDGRCMQLVPEGASLEEGVYRLVLDTGKYFAAQNTVGLYPVVEITFAVRDGESHFHIPLLLSPNGYTTYRGS